MKRRIKYEDPETIRFNVPETRDLRVYLIVAVLQSLPVVQTKPGTAFKIGVSDHPRRRLMQVQTGCPFELRMDSTDLHTGKDSREFEAEMHRRLDHLAVGGEWFFGDPDLAFDTASDIENEWCEAAFQRYRGLA